MGYGVDVLAHVADLCASVFRDEKKTEEEKAQGRKMAQDYIRDHEGNLITRPEILKTYED